MSKWRVSSIGELLINFDHETKSQFFFELLSIEAFYRRKDGTLEGEEAYCIQFPAYHKQVSQVFENLRFEGETVRIDNETTAAGKVVLESSSTFLPGYRNFSILGEGGMGIVFRATQIELGRQVAVKTYKSAGELPESETEGCVPRQQLLRRLSTRESSKSLTFKWSEVDYS